MYTISYLVVLATADQVDRVAEFMSCHNNVCVMTPMPVPIILTKRQASSLFFFVSFVGTNNNLVWPAIHTITNNNEKLATAGCNKVCTIIYVGR